MNTETAFQIWFRTFIEEKNPLFQVWEILHEGNMHYIDSDVVYEAIMGAPGHEQKSIKDILVQIDFRNGDVNHFFEHLAKGLVANY